MSTLYTIDPTAPHPDHGLNRLLGPVTGLATVDWPRHRGRPMQHLLTLDLQTVELEAAAARGQRLLMVFVEALGGLVPGDGPDVVLRWAAPEAVAAYPQTVPPPDFVADRIVFDPEYEALSRMTFLPEITQYPLEPGESGLGGAPGWGELGPPEDGPGGAFLLQFSLERELADDLVTVYIFEGGVVVRPTHPEDAPFRPRWSNALGATHILTVMDAPPPVGAVQKWGGVARGVYELDPGWVHLLTLEGDFGGHFEESVAVTIIIRLTGDRWHPSDKTINVFPIDADELAEWTPDDASDGPVLPERALVLRSPDPDSDWRALTAHSLIGPRPAWRQPFEDPMEFLIQLGPDLLPGAPDGTAYLVGSTLVWQPTTEPASVASAPAIPSLLGEVEANGAVVVGWRVTWKTRPTDDTFTALATATHALGWTLFVPGDTSATGASLPDTCIIGKAVVQGGCDEAPLAFDYDTVRRALDTLTPLSKSDRAALRSNVAGIKGFAKPGACVVAWGPLASASVWAGCALAAEDEAEARYEYTANQDMSQAWGPVGVDGRFVRGADGQTVSTFSVSEAAETRAFKAVAALDTRQLWLVVRYD